MNFIVGGFATVDARQMGDEAHRLQLPTDAWAGKANSYLCPLGPESSRAWLLMLRQDVLEVQRKSDASDTKFTLEVNDFAQPQKIKNLYWVGSRRVSGGYDADPNVVYLSEFADSRWLAGKFSPSVNRSYNVRFPAETTTFYEASKTDEGATWTWETMTQDLWDTCGLLGTYPGLPATVDGSPENFQFWGVSAYHALCSVLDRLDFAIQFRWDLGTFKIVQIGAIDGTHTTAVNKAQSSLVWSEDVLEPVYANSAAKDEIYFTRRDYQTCDNPQDLTWSDHVQQFPTHMEEKTPPIISPVAGTRRVIWDDLRAEYAADGSVSNQADLTSRAASRSTLAITRRAITTLRNRYSGLHPFQSGSQVKLMAFRNFGDGLFTEIWNEEGLYSGGSLSSPLWSNSPNLLPPDLARLHFPVHRAVWAKADATISAGGSGTVSVWHWNGSEFVDSDFDITGYAHPLEATIASGAWVRAVWHYEAKRWLLVQADCPA